jgi:hypothetical protein
MQNGKFKKCLLQLRVFEQVVKNSKQESRQPEMSSSFFLKLSALRLSYANQKKSCEIAIAII